MSERPPRYFFVHLQKTAGTALFRRLRYTFGSDAVYPRPDEQGTPEAVLDVDRLRRCLSVGDGYQVVTGHFPLCVVDVLDGPYATFTVLRDPVERVLSFLRHQREVEPRFAGWPLEDIYAQPIATGPLVREHMVRMLSLTVAEMTDGALTDVQIDDERRRRAEQNLTARIDVFGLQEHFESFCTDLEQTFDWDLGSPLFMNRTAPAPASAELRNQIAQDNPQDVRFYRFAVDLWSRRHGAAAGDS